MEKRSADSPHGRVKRTKVLVVPDPDEADVQRDLLPSSSQAIPEDTHISKLPPEVLQKVFNFLSLEERKNASLVCTKWNEIANTNTFRKNEKLFFHGHQNFEISLSSLSNTKRNYLNLEFHNCDFPMPSNLLALTKKIRSLSFRNCALSVPFQIELFLKCDRLNEFYYKNTNDFNYPNDFHFSDKTIESLFEQQFVNRNLESLRVCKVGLHYMADDNIESLFLMFPNIKHLTFSNLLSSFRDSFSSAPTLLVSTILSKKDELESLKIALTEQNLRLLVPHTFTRLKKISVHLRDVETLPLLLSNLVVHQQYLEVISLKFDGYERPVAVFPNIVCDFISTVLEQCIHLKHLKLYYGHPMSRVPLDPKMFHALVSSKLMSFKTNALFVSTVHNFHQIFTPNSTNKTLRILRIGRMGDHRVLTLFIRWFQNLEFLELPCFFAEVLELISCFQKNLTILKLTLLRKGTFLFSEQDERSRLRLWNLNVLKYCLYSLPSLKILDLTWEGDRTFYYEIIPPSVKCLRLLLCGPTEGSLSPLKKLIGLEAIHIKSYNSSTTDLRAWTKICNSLKELRLLSLESWRDDILLTHDTYPFSEAHQHIFECCPSLRWLVHKALRSFQIFRFDQIDKRMEKVKWLSDWNRNLAMSKTSLVRRLNFLFFNFNEDHVM